MTSCKFQLPPTHLPYLNFLTNDSGIIPLVIISFRKQNHVLSLLPTHPFSLCHKFCIFFGRLPLAFLDKAVSTVFQRQCGAEGRHIVIRPFHPDSTGEIKAMFCKRWHSLYSVICWLTRERISNIKYCPFSKAFNKGSGSIYAKWTYHFKRCCNSHVQKFA